MDFSDLFNQEEFSDAIVNLKVASRKRRRDQAEDAAEEHEQEQQLQTVRTLRAHSVILSRSPVLKAEMQRWQQQQQEHSDPSAQTSSSRSQDRVATIVLDSEDHEPAAMAVLAAMYGATAIAEAELSDLQLLQVALIADMLQILMIAQHAVQAMCRNASTDGMSDALQDALVQLETWPACLQPVLSVLAGLAVQPDKLSLPAFARAWMAADSVQPDMTIVQIWALPNCACMLRVLLARLHDLQQVWESDDLVQQLLKLPLPAMQLLLEADGLTVPSEDIVLFTAQRYFCSQRTPEQQRTAAKHLAPLICCPQLSQRWLMELLTARNPSVLVLHPILEKVHGLMSLWQVPRFAGRQLLPLTNVPASWRLGPRSFCRSVDSIEMTWDAPVAQLKASSVKAFEGRTANIVYPKEPGCQTPPLFGARFYMLLRFNGSEAGTVMSAECLQMPSAAGCRVFMDVAFTFSIAGHSRSGTALTDSDGSRRLASCPSAAAFVDFLGIGPMAGGWDDIAWANAGLPTAGTVQIKMKVSLLGG